MSVIPTETANRTGKETESLAKTTVIPRLTVHVPEAIL